MPTLSHYPDWLGQVNRTLSDLSNELFNVDDFDYPWIEAFLGDKKPDEAARAALTEDGFIVENLPAPAMLSKFPRERARQKKMFLSPAYPAIQIQVFGNRDRRGSDNEINIWLDAEDRLHIRVYKADRCYSFEEVIETDGMVEVVQR